MNRLKNFKKNINFLEETVIFIYIYMYMDIYIYIYTHLYKVMRNLNLRYKI